MSSCRSTAEQSSLDTDQVRRQVSIQIYADTMVKEFSEDQRLLLKYSQELSATNGLDGDNPELNALPEHLQELAKRHSHHYAAFKRVGVDEERLKQEAIFAQRYITDFEEDNRAIQQRLASTPGVSNLPEYLGQGSNGFAYRSD
ncbi:MAG: hypothetical protein KDD62_09795, partial [Bdellovibrionales bacterium]|nr:hypothetical protein [Bdellovibrionales bacterium]